MKNESRVPFQVLLEISQKSDAEKVILNLGSKELPNIEHGNRYGLPTHKATVSLAPGQSAKLTSIR